MPLNNLKLSAAGLALIKGFEGCRLTSYQDLRGVWTIGDGHTGRDIVRGITITQAQSDAYLLADVAGAEHFVNSNCLVVLKQGQFDALVDFAFNCGIHALATSTLFMLVNQGRFAEASEEFTKWDHAGGKEVEGLKHRRLLEEARFDISAAIDYDFDAEYEAWCNRMEERLYREQAMFLRVEDDDELDALVKQLEEASQ